MEWWGDKMGAWEEQVSHELQGERLNAKDPLPPLDGRGAPWRDARAKPPPGKEVLTPGATGDAEGPVWIVTRMQ